MSADNDVHPSARIESATLDLLDALREARDEESGLVHEDAISEMNEILGEVGLEVFQVRRR